MPARFVRRNTSNSLADNGSGRVVENEVLNLGFGAGQKGSKHFQHRAALQLGGLHETGEAADVFRAGIAAGPQADLPENDQRSQGPFGVVVGRRSVPLDKGEDFGVFAGRGKQSLPERFGFGMDDRLFGDPVQFLKQLVPQFGARLFPGVKGSVRESDIPGSSNPVGRT